MPESRPNILLLMTDQQRWDTLGCYGNEVIRTPNIDALAASGVRFANACTPTPICVAARMSFITGHRMRRTHWVANGALPGPVPELPTLMSLLLRAGYWTQGVGKMHFRGRHYGLRDLLTMEECVPHRADDDYLLYLRRNDVRTRFPMGIRDLLYNQPQTSGIPREHHPSTWTADRSIEFLREHRRYRGDQPFFLWSSWLAPHPPFAPCEPYDPMYDPAAMDLPPNTERPLADIPSCYWGNRGRLDGAHRDPDRMRRIRALYYGQISHVDNAVGRVLAELEELGLSDNTVVLFFSDHGEMLGDHGLTLKNCHYDGASRVPLLLRWPGRTEAGRVCDDMVGLTDVLPTFLDELGIAYPTEEHGTLPGASLLGAAGGGLAGEREAYFIDYGHKGGRWIAARTRTHKYALCACDDGVEELFDLVADPHETRNLAAAQPKLAAHFRELVLDWEREHGLPQSFENGRFRVFPRRDRMPTEDEVCYVTVNDGAWPKRLPPEEAAGVESYAEAFTRAISKETTLSPDKLSLADYKRKVLQRGPADPGGESLEGTPWEKAWRETAVID